MSGRNKSTHGNQGAGRSVSPTMPILSSQVCERSALIVIESDRRRDVFPQGAVANAYLDIVSELLNVSHF